MGLVISRKYGSLRESFDDASELLLKITFDQFKKFIEKNRALEGYNMTVPLLQKLFAEIDPHKKGYLNEHDWTNAFQAFRHDDQNLIELKNAIQVAFSDVDSAYQFFLSFKGDSKKKTISRGDFERAVHSLSSGRFSKADIDGLWRYLTENGKFLTLDKYSFRSHFDGIAYSGLSTIKETMGAKTTIVSGTSSSSLWEEDIIEKLRQIIKSSSLTFEDIFKKFDEDGNGAIS